MKEKVLLKDVLFNKAKVEQIATEIQHVYTSFRKSVFVRDVLARFPELELKARIGWIAECLKKYMPDDYETSVRILLKALPAPNNPELTDDDFGDFIYASYAEYVARYGCTKEHLMFSLNALYEITQRFSAEDAIRYFINAFPDETLETLLKWTEDPHYHVRRLCSEGTRPKLPWSQKVGITVTAPIPILDRLFSDTTRYVTRSVANHMNDISKINPDLVMTTLVRWNKTKRQVPKEMEYIIRHSLRTCIKEGDERALRMIGFNTLSDVRLLRLSVPRHVSLNTTLEFSFIVESNEDTHALIDYIIYFQNKAGNPTGKKVFKLTQQTLKKNTPVRVSKRHAFRSGMTTRVLYPGEHVLEIQINGKKLATAMFDLR